MLKVDFNNEFIQKNSLNILCAVILITLFLPIITMSSSANGYGQSFSYNGLDLIRMDNMISGLFVFILTPFIILCGDRIEATKKYMNVLCIIVPVISLLMVLQILLFVDAMDSAVSGAFSGGFMGIEIESDTSISFGGILLLASCIGLIVQGAIKYGYTFDKNGVEAFKENILEIINGHR